MFKHLDQEMTPFIQWFPGVKWSLRGGLTWSKPMPVNGQGVFTFNITRNNAFRVVVTTSSAKDAVVLVIGEQSAEFLRQQNNQYRSLKRVEHPQCGYEEGKKISYWFSYNRDSLVLKYGKGYTMEETTLLEYNFLAGATPAEEAVLRNRYHCLFNAEFQGQVQLYDSTHLVHSTVSARLIDIEKKVAFYKNPFVCNMSPIVLDSSKVTLFTLDNSKYMLTGSLPPACKELYENIRNCELNWPPEVDDVLLSGAIRFSIETEGCLLYEKLKSKAGEFGKGSGKEETYLRVTLGHSLGNSPGIPYVLEIWPSGHYSPIHNHGNANAVIKILFGEINISIYNKQTTEPDAVPMKTFNAYPGDVTWINRNWFQTHKLWNNTTDFCAPIQCYNYDAGDTTHWPYFDYVSENSTIEEFLPNSDFTFKDMRQKVLVEYGQKCSPVNSPNKK
ncbi:uncharacterized protein LOC110457384 [Mizuhopecten yessoensis]|nr:uncharacterized protein LOC110457384 [Mizuhopecten yessoensis]XP_021364306.1 uncharacterized protein LOC110457384 [Mizuhopecten yessoensis]XP_021364307.1 uncharacterized protein LOC110457384 [Mizuhopecten yessoensis]